MERICREMAEENGLPLESAAQLEMAANYQAAQTQNPPRELLTGGHQVCALSGGPGASAVLPIAGDRYRLGVHLRAMTCPNEQSLPPCPSTRNLPMDFPPGFSGKIRGG